MSSKLNYTPQRLESFVLELAKLKGFQSPTPFLDEMLKDVESFGDNEFTGDFFLNMHYLFQENADIFWNEFHRNDISEWFKKATFAKELFASTWEGKAKGKLPLLNDSKESKDVDNSPLASPVNPYPRIFKNYNCFLLFESLKEDVRVRCQLADLSFIYRRMQKDGFIFSGIVDTEFRKFLEGISIFIDKTKLLEYCTTDLKERNYNLKKHLFEPL